MDKFTFKETRMAFDNNLVDPPTLAHIDDGDEKTQP
jgi:hypothetical protein